MAIEKYPERIPVETFNHMIRALGFSPDNVRSMAVSKGVITLEVFDLDEAGNRQFSGDQNDVLTQTAEVKIV